MSEPQIQSPPQQVTPDRIKKTGTREMVYKGLALRTAGNLTKDDIEYKIINGKEWYISKKMSERMRELIKKSAFTRRKKTQVNGTSITNLVTNPSNTTTNSTNSTNSTNNNLSLQQPQNQSQQRNQPQSKTIKNIKFVTEKNNVQEVFYNELSDYDIAELRAEAELEDTMRAPNPFTIENMDDLDLDKQLLSL